MMPRPRLLARAATVSPPLAGGLALLGVVAAAASCASAVGSSGVEDKARRDVPVAICRKALAPADTTDNGAPRPEAYWSVMFPKFRGFGAAVEPTTADCVGENVLAPPGGPPVTSPTIGAGDLTIAPGDEGLQVAWLKAAAVSDRVALGPLALLRPRASELDVYAIGAYHGSTRHSRFELAKIGSTPVLVVRDEACGDAKPGGECESSLRFYLVGGGRLAEAASTLEERTQLGTMKDVGRVAWRLTTEPPTFDATSVHVKEKLSVRDSGDDEVRRSEGERVFTLRGLTLVAGADSVWSQVKSTESAGPVGKSAPTSK
jgi:hypothetical protein